MTSLTDLLIGQSDSFGNDWLQSLQRTVNILNYVLGTVNMLQKLFQYVCGIYVVGNVYTTFYAPPCTYTASQLK